MSPLPGPWICPAPPLRTPSPACHCVRYLSGRQHLCSCCERVRGAATGHTYGQPCSTSRRPHPRAHCFRVPALPCRDTRADSVHTGLAEKHNRALLMLCAGCESTLALQHTCIAGTHALQHTLCRCDAAVDLYLYLQKRGWDGYRPLNGCSQGLVVRGNMSPCTLSFHCLYKRHFKGVK